MINSIIKRYLNCQFYLPSTIACSIIAILYTFLYNNHILNNAILTTQSSGVLPFLSALCIRLTIFLISFSILYLFASSYLFKLWAAFCLISTAIILFYIKNFNLVFDHILMASVFGTSLNETKEFMNGTDVVKFSVIYGIIPAILVLLTPVRYGFRLSQRLLIIAICVAGILFIRSKSSVVYVMLRRSAIYHNINPIGYLSGTLNYIDRNIIRKMMPIKKIGLDAKKDPQIWQDIKKPNVFILVIGEAARADRFGINGYKRPTSEMIEKTNPVNFTNTQSCGTSTIVSVGCMLSHLSRDDFVKNKTNYDGLPHILKRSGFEVSWLDNNSPCYSFCKDIGYRFLPYEKNGKHCSKNGTCYDSILADELDKSVDKINSGDHFILLHMHGSHTSYHLRYPPEFEKFSPSCTSAAQGCKKDHLDNAYDNTIAYTDHILSQIVISMKKRSNLNYAILFVSDHGESLGENGIYGHAYRYNDAPMEQKHVPMMIWMSDGFIKDFKINKRNLNAIRQQSLSHDAVFHTTLGMLGIKTKLYNKNLDLSRK